MSAGDTPAVLFYLLDRHALLAMTRGSKRVFLNALPHPPSCFARHPPPPQGAVGILVWIVWGFINVCRMDYIRSWFVWIIRLLPCEYRKSMHPYMPEMPRDL